MAGSNKRRDLADFSDWLEDHRYLAPGSAYNYASFVRTTLKAVEHLDPDTLAEYFFESMPRRSRSPRLTAWRAFVEWAALRGLAVPLPKVVPEKRRRDGFDLPPEVLAALTEMKEASVTVPAMAGLRWDHVTSRGSDYAGGDWVEVADPNEPNTFLLVSRDSLAVLEAWNPTGREEGGPLVPSAIGSRFPMPLNPLKRLLARHKRSQQESSRGTLSLLLPVHPESQLLDASSSSTD
jgi:hypothetical protein